MKKVFSNKKAVIFDLDGTLADTIDAIAKAVNLTLDYFGYPKKTISEVRAAVGNGARMIIRRTLPAEFYNDEETVSRYHSENIVVVTYGSEMGDPYKSIILNYNNYTVNVVYDHTDDGIDNGIEYTIPAYEFVVIEHKPTND